MKKKITYFYIYVYLLIIKIKKKSRRNLSLPYYKELKLVKLEYHRRKIKEHYLQRVAWNSSLPSSSSMWHFFNTKIHASTSFFYET